MSEFTHNLDELMYLSNQKHILTRHLEKNYRENVHYIIEKQQPSDIRKHGGHNKIIYKLNESAFQLFKNSFNLRNRYIVNISENIKCVNIGMCIENQTIGEVKNEQYQYSIITVTSQISLWVITRNVQEFYDEYEKTVTDYLDSQKYHYETIVQDATCKYAEESL